MDNIDEGSLYKVLADDAEAWEHEEESPLENLMEFLEFLRTPPKEPWEPTTFVMSPENAKRFEQWYTDVYFTNNNDDQ